MAITNYMVQEGEFPVSLEALVQRRYFLEKQYLVDPWGESIGYEHGEGEDFVIWSSGPDKKLGTADDIIDGFPPSYVASWKAKNLPPVNGQKTNAVQETTAGVTQPPSAVEKTPPGRVPVTTVQPPAKPDNPDNPADPKTTPWKIPLLIGLTAIIGVLAAWRCFRKKRT